jgi:hypothetical protein
MLLAPRIAPMSFGDVGEQNAGSFAEYFSRDSEWAFISSKVGSREGIFSKFLMK